MSSPRVLLVDGHGLAYRAFYAMPELSAADGTPTQVLVGFNNMFLKIVEEQGPSHVCVFFDEAGPTFRHEHFKAYKETRKPTPEDLKVQIPLLRECLRLMGVCVHSRSGYEADDEIAACAVDLAGKVEKVIILSADKDMFQILREGVEILRPVKGVSQFKTYDVAAFTVEYGFAPPLMADYLALVGDTADNIPGVRGIGAKGAQKLLVEYGGMDSIYGHLEDLPGGTRAKLEEGREMAFASLELARLREDGSVPLEDMALAGGVREGFDAFCRRYGLSRLAEKMGTPHEKVTSEIVAEDTRHGPEALSVPMEALLARPQLALSLERGEEGLLLGIAAEDGSFWEGGSPSVPQEVLGWLTSGSLITWDYKDLCRLLPREFRYPDRVWDCRIAGYLLHPDRAPSSLPGAEGLSPGRRALALFALKREMEPALAGMENLMASVELPLCPVLADMESRGLSADGGRLQTLEEKLEGQLRVIEARIEELAGQSVNLSSPRQVAELLFDHLGLPPLKKTKTGYSTDVTVLEELSGLPVPEAEVPRLLLEYREAAKMASGFVRPFLELAGASRGGKIHTTFEHTATGTGRLSSRDPNIQNLPVFGRWADELRSCFGPGEPGLVFVAADYSQIELRVLAHLCGDSRLQEAFREERDIHRETAGWVFGVPADEVTPDLRRSAKVVNFGLLYGMSAFGLARRMGIGRAEASEIVERYFSVFPGVRAYLEESYEKAVKRGYTLTLFGRRRPLDEVGTVEGRGNGALKRVAVNSPIQGTAADIARMAMIAWESGLSSRGWEGELVLQVHDSLVCQCSPGKAQQIAAALRETMESAATLDVPLVAETKTGKTLLGV